MISYIYNKIYPHEKLNGANIDLHIINDITATCNLQREPSWKHI